MGTSGIEGRRCGAATAIAMSRFSLMNGSADGRLSKIIGTWPATASLRAGPAPLYPMCSSPRPDSDLNSSICRWPIPPVPEVANAYLPGWALTSVMNDLKSFAGKLGCTASTLGVAAMLMIEVKSVSGLYFTAGLIAGAEATEDTVATPSV